MWTLTTIFAVRPDLATREIVDRVANAAEISCPGFHDFYGKQHREDVAKAAKDTLNRIAKSRPELASPIQPTIPTKLAVPRTPSELGHA